MRMQILSTDAQELMNLITARLLEIEYNQSRSPLDGQAPEVEALKTLAAFLAIHPEIEVPLWVTMKKWLRKNLP